MAPDKIHSNPAFHRVQILTGKQALARIGDKRVIVFGLGGVGSWCAEALVRSGIRNVTIVDSDVVCVTNLNRQVQATTLTIGKSKADEMRRRLLEINPSAEIIPVKKVFSKATAPEFDLKAFDYVIDAIDSLSNKVELIMRASTEGPKVFTALGASSKMDPGRIRTSSLWDSYGCPLGKFVRKKLRQRGFRGEVTAVWSDEECELHAGESVCGTGTCHCPKAKIDKEEEVHHEWCSSKKRINGSVVHITGTIGFMLAGLVIQDIVRQSGSCGQVGP